jgi:hypothetical protein
MPCDVGIGLQLNPDDTRTRKNLTGHDAWAFLCTVPLDRVIEI